MNYKFIEHTADIGFEAYGNSYGMLLKNSYSALFSIMCYVKRIKHRVSEGLEKPLSYEFSLEDKDISYLLWRSLQESISQSDAEAVFFYSAEAISLKGSETGFKVDITLMGVPKRPEFAKLDVKSMTFYNFSIGRSKTGLLTLTAIVDI
ncbi:MAG: archease [Candidatus Micrarchaeia archaeon]